MFTWVVNGCKDILLFWALWLAEFLGWSDLVGF